MSVLNGQEHIRLSMDSILAQEYRHFELLVADDGSSDDTLNILNEYADRDSRVSVIVNERNRGVSWTANHLIQRARGEYIARHDADDISLPERFGLQLKCFEENPEAVAVSTDLEFFDEKGTFLLRKQVSELDMDLLDWRLIFHNPLGGHGQIMLRKSALEQVGGYDEACRYAMDYELWVKLERHYDVPFRVVPQCLYRYIVRKSGSLTATIPHVDDKILFEKCSSMAQDLTGVKIKWEQRPLMLNFWAKPRDFKSEELNETDLLTRRLYTGYIRNATPEKAKRLRQEIARQWIKVFGEISATQYPKDKIARLWKALYWDPCAAIQAYWNTRWS